MLIVIENVLSPEEVALARSRLLEAEWEDGRITAGSRAVAV